MRKQKIIFRADASAESGLGHISRCLAIAELLSSEYDICFATLQTSSQFLSLIEKVTTNIILLAAPHAKETAGEFVSHLSGEEIVVLDGYQFTADYEVAVKKYAAAVVSIDDIPSRHFHADLILNFCGLALPHLYSKEQNTLVFSGLEYLVLRSPFLRQHIDKQFNHTLFVNMGGTDPHNATVMVLETLLSERYDGNIEVVVGPHFREQDRVKEIAVRHGKCRIHVGLTSMEMFDLMSKCSFAILPPSTVALEFLSTGGLVFLYQTADNQELLNKYLGGLHIVSDFRDFQSVLSSDELPAVFSERNRLQKTLINHQSLSRVKRLFSALVFASNLGFRKAALSDARLCFEWVNEREGRRFSYSTEEIPWDRHLSWFEEKITDTKCHYFIVVVKGEAIGQVRFDLADDNTFQISYGLDARWRGKGLAPFVLSKALTELQKHTLAKKFVGYVQKLNLASIKAFHRVGFRRLPTTRYPDSLLFQFP